MLYRERTIYLVYAFLFVGMSTEAKYVYAKVQVKYLRTQQYAVGGRQLVRCQI